MDHCFSHNYYGEGIKIFLQLFLVLFVFNDVPVQGVISKQTDF